VRFATIGILQFIAPTMQFLLGVFVYHEPMPAGRLTSFLWIWIAVLLYAISQRKRALAAKPNHTQLE